MATKRMSVDDWIKIAEKLAKRNGGYLPTYTEQVESGYGSLRNAIRKYPYKFAHLPIRPTVTKSAPKKVKRQTPLEKWIPFAEKMAKSNGGQVLSVNALRKSNIPNVEGFIRCMADHQEEFKHLRPNANPVRALVEKKPSMLSTLLLVKKLKKEIKGDLTVDWLRSNGYQGTADIVSKWPKVFAKYVKVQSDKD